MIVNEIPFASFFEDGIKLLTEKGAENIVLCSRLPDGTVLTGYEGEMTAEEKASMAMHILSDAFMDVVLANIGKIKDALDEYEEADDAEE